MSDNNKNMPIKGVEGRFGKQISHVKPQKGNSGNSGNTEGSNKGSTPKK